MAFFGLKLSPTILDGGYVRQYSASVRYNNWENKHVRHCK